MRTWEVAIVIVAGLIVGSLFATALGFALGAEIAENAGYSVDHFINGYEHDAHRNAYSWWNWKWFFDWLPQGIMALFTLLLWVVTTQQRKLLKASNVTANRTQEILNRSERPFLILKMIRVPSNVHRKYGLNLTFQNIGREHGILEHIDTSLEFITPQTAILPPEKARITFSNDVFIPIQPVNGMANGGMVSVLTQNPILTLPSDLDVVGKTRWAVCQGWAEYSGASGDRWRHKFTAVIRYVPPTALVGNANWDMEGGRQYWGDEQIPQ